MERQQHVHPIASLEAVATPEDLLELQAAVRDVYVDELIKRYIVQIVEATREHPAVIVGASPRGSLALFRGGQARALRAGRDYVLPEDVKALVEPVLGHRLILSAAARVTDATPRSVLEEVVRSVAVPGTTARAWFRG
jgi:MoxR-like ATPase